LYLSPPRSDLGLTLGLRLFAASGLALLLIIVWFLFKEASTVLNEVGLTRFMVDADWHPTENSFGLAPMLMASVLSSLGAVVLAGPIGLGAAVYCRFYSGPRLSSLYRQLLGVFAGIPSVVFGLWGLTVLVPLVAQLQAPGSSLLAGILVLAMMVLPTIALTSHAALAAVQPAYLAAGHALGMSRSTIVLKVAMVAARGGILAGIIMALGRALGETMAMLMVSGNIVQLPRSLFDPVRTLAANIALEMAYAMGTHRSALFACGLALIAIVGVLTLISERLSRGASHA
jgi:phosphate transport system permease protein